MNIVTNPEIHKEFWKRIKELELTQADIIQDAEERGLHGLSKSRLSKYKSAVKRGDFKESLTPYMLGWLCVRYGINILIRVGVPVIKDDKVRFIVETFDEAKALWRLKMSFPDTKMRVEDIK